MAISTHLFLLLFASVFPLGNFLDVAIDNLSLIQEKLITITKLLPSCKRNRKVTQVDPTNSEAFKLNVACAK